jgi:DNA (cytosine-5)-methyltransferase 1
MRVASVCSGIGGAELALAGIAHHAFAAETDPFARAVLAHRFPDLKVHHDFTKIPASAGPVDVLVGGTPCQSFSIAGLRGGMADERGNLALEFLRLAERLRARWVLWENVPGVLSSNDGRDFGAFVGGLAELGYGWAYRSLDAQHFGLAQRRVRVFVVGYLGDWRRAAAVLFEPASLRGDSAPSREAGKTTATTLASRASAGGGLGTDFDCDGGLIAFGGNNTAGAIDVATAVNAHGGPHGRLDFESETFVAHPLRAQAQPSHRADSDTYIAHSLRAEGVDAGEDGTGRGTPLVAFDARQSDTITYGDMSGPLDTDGHSVAVAFAQNQRAEVRCMDVAGALAAEPGAKQQTYAVQMVNCNSTPEVSEDIAMPLRSNDGSGNRQGLATASSVRRLTPRECERLQGFPDGWTDVVYRGKPAADGPRYQALGNAFAVPVVRWIARRLVREDAASVQPGVLAA